MGHMGKGAVRLGDLEREVMQRLWAADGPLTVRAIHAELAASRDLAYTTVMTVLDRLTKKGVVRRVREGKAYLYEPLGTREQLVADLMHEALDGAADRSDALVRFVGGVTEEEAAALREALARMEGRPPRRGGRRSR